MSEEKPIKIKQLEEEKPPFDCQSTCMTKKGCTCINKQFK